MRGYLLILSSLLPSLVSSATDFQAVDPLWTPYTAGGDVNLEVVPAMANVAMQAGMGKGVSVNGFSIRSLRIQMSFKMIRCRHGAAVRLDRRLAFPEH